MSEGGTAHPVDSGAVRRCQLALVLLLLSMLHWQEGGSPFVLSASQEQVGTVIATIAALVLAIQINPTLAIARIPCLLIAGSLVAASLVPCILTGVTLTMLLSARFALVVLTIWLLAPTITAKPAATLRTYLWSHAVIALCLAAGAALAPGMAFQGGTRRLVGLLPPMHPSQVGAVAAVTIGLSLLAGLTGTVSGRLASSATLLASIVLVLSRSRTATLATLLGISVALASLAPRWPRARKLLAVLAVLAAVTWFVCAPVIVDWFARGQTHAQLGTFSGRRGTWVALLHERPAGISDLLGVGLGDKRYKGNPIDSGWVAAYWEQGVVGVGVTVLLLLAICWQALWSRDDLLRAVALFLSVFVAVSANTETGISDSSIYFLSLMLAGLLTAACPSMTQGNRHADRRRAQPLPLRVTEWRESGGRPGDRPVAPRRA
jgi:hypothetical protein